MHVDMATSAEDNFRYVLGLLPFLPGPEPDFRWAAPATMR
jgi:hypothetical protein